ncbi:response regulator [Lyngbya sp. CCY1209]|jgi:CheY-like chemotaxis protein|uniref:response regulator n=1 Tax=Lyngbya sp. CCY1209 TaxID=2886103 RepID=UPI002D216E69|nr:response regulator [Lyngbya sp. CCY1209]MEB3883548.1 response regulator [Lyngbya sp. CCY1209]
MATKRILLIDDEDDIREIAQLSLEMIGGWTVATADSGNRGLETARAQRPDAILLDVMMPGLDGFATFQKLQADPQTREIPVILLTAKVQSADRQKFDRLGVSGVISKPFEPMSLAEEVAHILGWS